MSGVCVCSLRTGEARPLGLKPPTAVLAVLGDTKVKAGWASWGLPLLTCIPTALSCSGRTRGLHKVTLAGPEKLVRGHTLPPPRPGNFISRVETQILGIPDTLFHGLEKAL